MELKRLQHEKDGLSKELEIEKEKTHAYQASFEQLQRQGINMTPATLDNEAMTSAKKLATLEMKEINERQRAEHAVRSVGNPSSVQSRHHYRRLQRLCY